jgi:hypothetical protein
VDEIQTLSIAIASASVVAGVIYYILQIRQQRKEREKSLVISLVSAFSSKEFQMARIRIQRFRFKDAEEFWKKYSPEADADAFATWLSVADFYEEVGILLFRRIIDVGLVYDLLATPIILDWERMEPIVKYRREQLERPLTWQWFECLYHEMKKREQRQGSFFPSGAR